MKKYYYLFILTFPAMLIFTNLAFSEPLYVHSVKATLFETPSMSAKVIEVVKKGDKLTLIKQQGYWYQVSHKGKKVWVYKFLVRKKQAINSKSLYSKMKSIFFNIESIAGKARRRPSSYTATAAARGLREKRKHFAGEYTYDYDALKKLEAITIDAKELDAFMAQ